MCPSSTSVPATSSSEGKSLNVLDLAVSGLSQGADKADSEGVTSFHFLPLGLKNHGLSMGTPCLALLTCLPIANLYLGNSSGPQLVNIECPVPYQPENVLPSPAVRSLR